MNENYDNKKVKFKYFMRQTWHFSKQVSKQELFFKTARI